MRVIRLQTAGLPRGSWLDCAQEWGDGFWLRGRLCFLQLFLEGLPCKVLGNRDCHAKVCHLSLYGKHLTERQGRGGFSISAHCLLWLWFFPYRLAAHSNPHMHGMKNRVQLMALAWSCRGTDNYENGPPTLQTINWTFTCHQES